MPITHNLLHELIHDERKALAVVEHLDALSNPRLTALRSSSTALHLLAQQLYCFAEVRLRADRAIWAGPPDSGRVDFNDFVFCSLNAEPCCSGRRPAIGTSSQKLTADGYRFSPPLLPTAARLLPTTLSA